MKLRDRIASSLSYKRQWTLGRYFRRPARITKATGTLPVEGASRSFAVVVGPSFDQHRPDAMMTCRLGYCHAFEDAGVPYRILDVDDIPELLDMPDPIVMITSSEFAYMRPQYRRLLSRQRVWVWVPPWFRGSRRFFEQHRMDWRTWTVPAAVRRAILEIEPAFVFSATVESGLQYFEEWAARGARVVSLPLACDTRTYRPNPPHHPEFDGIQLAFVGGYWKSKARQIDPYLRPLEEQLVIYGYSRWPYKGYRGLLEPEKETSLYHQATLCPTINEPTVALMRGQINERVFKVLGSGGVTVVDAVPAYRELFAESELPIPGSCEEFHQLVRELMSNGPVREQYRRLGTEAVLSRHTYARRVDSIFGLLGQRQAKNGAYRDTGRQLVGSR